MAESKPDLTLYGDLISQPVRAVYWLLKMKKVPFTFVQTSIFTKKTQMDRFSPEYVKINRLSRIPSLVDTAPKTGPRSSDLLASSGGALVITESAAILEYLADKYGWDDLYPSDDLALRAKINEYLHFHHLQMRPIHAALTRPLVVASLGGKAPMNAQILAKGRKDAKAILNWYEETLAARAVAVGASAPASTPASAPAASFVPGGSAATGLDKPVFLVANSPTLADFQAFCEIITYDAPPYGIGVLPSLRSDFPHIARWLTTMASLPAFDTIANTRLFEGSAKRIDTLVAKL